MMYVHVCRNVVAIQNDTTSLDSLLWGKLGKIRANNETGANIMTAPGCSGHQSS
jgi:hypothetical protein